jgi:predicted CoA-binding protein
MHKKTLVLGASLKPNRYSNFVINKLVENKVEVVAFGMKAGMIAGIIIDTDLKSYKDVHTVTLYLNSKRQSDYYDYIISLNPKRIIFNPGTENPEFYDILKKQHIPFEVACTLTLLTINQY